MMNGRKYIVSIETKQEFEEDEHIEEFACQCAINPNGDLIFYDDRGDVIKAYASATWNKVTLP